MEYAAIIDAKRTRFADLEDVMGRPNFFEDAKKATELMREHRSLARLLESWDAFGKAQTELGENREMAKSLDDPELAAATISSNPVSADGKSLPAMDLDPTPPSIGTLSSAVPWIR